MIYCDEKFTFKHDKIYFNQIKVCVKWKCEDDVNSTPGSYIKRTLTGGIKIILTSIFERGGVGNGHICVEFLFVK
jgi:hypothetical protein